MPFDSLDPKAVLRMAALFIHVLALAVAAAGVALGDYGVMGGRCLSRSMLRKGAQWVLGALMLLWASGLVLIGIDTGFDPVVMGGNPKLMAKLTIVTLLTINGWALHHFALPLLLSNRKKTLGPLPALLGAVSAASWLFALFVGVSKAVAPVLGYGGYMLLYALAIVSASIVALSWARPLLQRQHEALHETLRAKGGRSKTSRDDRHRKRASAGQHPSAHGRLNVPTLRVVC